MAFTRKRVPLPQPDTVSYRKEMTKALTQNAADYLTKKGYSVHQEIGVCRRGRRRADVLALNTKNDLMVIEVKSCAADWKSDKKWTDYLAYCNRFYFCIDEEFYESKAGQALVEDAKAHGAGVMVSKITPNRQLMPLLCKHPAKRRDVPADVLYPLLTRMAWRGGHFKYRTPIRSLDWENVNGIWYQFNDKL